MKNHLPRSSSNASSGDATPKKQSASGMKLCPLNVPCVSGVVQRGRIGHSDALVAAAISRSTESRVKRVTGLSRVAKPGS